MGSVHSSGPPESRRYWLKNLRMPPGLCDTAPHQNNWQDASILIENCKIAAVETDANAIPHDADAVDLKQSVVFSALVDSHVHLAKAHVAAFDDFAPGDLLAAIHAMAENRLHWEPETVAARIEFSLESAFAYGVRAMRTHIDVTKSAPRFTADILFDAQRRWADRIELQITPLAGINEFDDPALAERVFSIAQRSGILGMFIFDNPDLPTRLRPLFERAQAEGWDIDLHVDEGLDPALDGLNAVGATALTTGFSGQILCGHCVALNSYDETRRANVVDQAVRAGVHFVSLPVTNLYLQGRTANNVPQIRGMTPVHYLSERNATVSLGADNVRDAFCTFGEFDPASVLNLAAQVGHLAEAARDWAQLITTNPSRTMALGWDGKINPGAPADLVIFAARNSGEFGSGAGIRRTVIRGGKWLDVKVPDFRDLNPIDRR